VTVARVQRLTIRPVQSFRAAGIPECHWIVERLACDRLVLLLSERRQRLDARGAARGQVGRERGDGA
jgi:hypothetical protein